MEKVKIDKMECRYPTLFNVMWIAIVVWMVVSIANYFGQWLEPDMLDGFGMSILVLFAITCLVCFWSGMMNLVSEHGMCFNLFSGRIRRLGIEVALALMMLGYLSINLSNDFLTNMMVVLIAGAFLFDIWRFADF